ncbi:hypothetical protein T484DRAFT_1823211 [Baffinella frigidus]|nr:hypothetical protein T484DRAFT_1823211 [Cryptophyta sp. CCMP2293]
MPAVAVWIALAATLTHTATLETQRSSHPFHPAFQARRGHGRAAGGGCLWRDRRQLVLRGGGEEVLESRAGGDEEERLEMVGKVTEEVTEGAAWFPQATFFLFDEAAVKWREQARGIVELSRLDTPSNAVLKFTPIGGEAGGAPDPRLTAAEAGREEDAAVLMPGRDEDVSAREASARPTRAADPLPAARGQREVAARGGEGARGGGGAGLRSLEHNLWETIELLFSESSKRTILYRVPPSLLRATFSDDADLANLAANNGAALVNRLMPGGRGGGAANKGADLVNLGGSPSPLIAFRFRSLDDSERFETQGPW